MKNSIESILHAFSEYYLVSINPSRKDELFQRIHMYGYLPYSHQRALEELSNEETWYCLLEKLKFQKVYVDNQVCCNADSISPVKRYGYTTGAWLGEECHEIKLINLAALGDRLFIDWIRQLIILPSGRFEEGTLGTTLYILPFHSREFGCNYIPKAYDVSEALIDTGIKDTLGLCGEEQLKAFISIAQLAGHPVIYDVLPQTGRYNLDVIKNPSIVRWFDSANSKFMGTKIEQIEIVNKVNNIILDMYKEHLTANMQANTHKCLTSIKEEQTKDLPLFIQENQLNIITTLMSKGFWPAPGGSWNSCGSCC